MLSGLPYEKSEISREQNDPFQTYSLFNRKTNFRLDAEFVPKDSIKVKSALDIWLTERYCLYFDRGTKLFRYEIHHAEWKLNHIDLKLLTVDSQPVNIAFDRIPDLIHYSAGVKVLAWEKRLISQIAKRPAPDKPSPMPI
jgi:uncharacterized protein YqjF (DUF2071 family)